jgi:hypothetical protein
MWRIGFFKKECEEKNLKGESTVHNPFLAVTLVVFFAFFQNLNIKC